MKKQTIQDKNEELTFIPEGDPLELVPDGKYEVSYVKHAIKRFYNCEKLYITFKICTPGEYFEKDIFRAYNYYKKLPVGSDLYKDFQKLFETRLRKKTHLSINLFKGKILKVTTRTVKQDRKQQARAEHQQYSVVDSIIQVVAGKMERS